MKRRDAAAVRAGVVPPIAGVVLAAGASRRFGAQKLLAPLDGQPLVRWAVERMVASPVTSTLVVLGAHAAEVERALAGLPVRCVVNERFAEGLSTSVETAVRALAREAPRAAVFALGDQPRVPSGVVGRLIHAFRASGAPIVVPVYADGERGHPVLFAANIFPELLALHGDEGARRVIERDRSRVTRVAIDAAAPRDVDTVEDLEKLGPMP